VEPESEPVGLDFGTATTLAAYRTAAGTTSVVPLGRVTVWLPSVARVDGTGYAVGESVEESAPEQVIRSVKRAITQGRDTVAVGRGQVRDEVPVPAGSHVVPVDPVITAILATAADRAEQAGLPIRGRPVRLGAPSMWDGRARRRLLRLAAAAGLTVTAAGLHDEPVAAGAAWLAHRYLGYGERPAGRVLVVDLGGGTVDVAVLAVEGGPSPRLSVQASLGVAVAGDALDAAIARDLAAEMVRHRIDPAWHPSPDLAWALLERAAREAKVRLSAVDEHPVVLPPALGFPHVIRYRREQLEEAFAAQLDGVENLAVAALRAARITRGAVDPAGLRALTRDELVGDVDYVLLAGGLSRIPAVGARLSALFADAQIHGAGGAGLDPTELVVAGLAGAGFERVGLDRPGFDLVLEFDGGRRTLYEAYTPLYQPWQVYNGHSELAFEGRLRAPDLPTTGTGRLVAVSSDGQPVPVRLDGVAVAGLAVRFGAGEVVLRIGPDGRIDLRDGAGGRLSVRVDGWPAGGVTGHAGLDLRRTVSVGPAP
jgi:molecular chaperone DnaK (HSP70)